MLWRNRTVLEIGTTMSPPETAITVMTFVCMQKSKGQNKNVSVSVQVSKDFKFA